MRRLLILLVLVLLFITITPYESIQDVIEQESSTNSIENAKIQVKIVNHEEEQQMENTQEKLEESFASKWTVLESAWWLYHEEGIRTNGSGIDVTGKPELQNILMKMRILIMFYDAEPLDGIKLHSIAECTEKVSGWTKEDFATEYKADRERIFGTK